MKVSSRIDGSICGAIRLHRPSWTSVQAVASSTGVKIQFCIVASYSNGPGLSHGGGAGTGKGTAATCNTRQYTTITSISGERNNATPPDRHNTPGALSSRSLFLHRPLLRAPILLRPSGSHGISFFRSFLPTSCTNHTSAATAATEPEPSPDDYLDGAATEDTKPKDQSSKQATLTREDVLALVDPYDDEDPGTVEEHLQFFRDPYMRGYARSNVPKITIARTRDDVEFPSLEEVTPANEQQKEILWNLRFAILSRLRNPQQIDLDGLYDLYLKLPEPRMPFLQGRLRHLFLKALGQPAKKDSKSMLRYFSVIADVRDGGFSLTTSEWNAAISFASRYVGTVTEAETEAALKLWREMELESSVKATDVTFNILFDVASKSGNFVLAEMIYREMESRGHRFNRYHYVSLIHFFGLKQDTIAMRAAYREMVNAGEIVDTVTLNAIISGLLRSGEEYAAEKVYDRMLKAAFAAAYTAAERTDDSQAKKTLAMPARNYLTDRAVTQALIMFAKLGRKQKHLQRLFQDNPVLIHPDLHTYRILVNHYGVKQGDLSKVAQFLDDMRLFQIPLHGAIFLALFKGFAIHGGISRSAWSEQRLDGIWLAFLQALDDKVDGLFISTWLAGSALRAFAKCSDRKRLLSVYEHLKNRWALDKADESYMVDFLAGLLKKMDKKGR
ncbi:hypothetical protein QBC37DRAFT_423806 [Rhypophila decipiens]|uniref:Pentatricopeptide repeat-containing protein n=1 Tax=Rhypophila decipiens TaxID=261697 RepID=A0AAN6Y6G2_9PEZI|nr:hypothetical protein QBC37DRAFT_423806 [Rhypophila decipiens]